MQRCSNVLTAVESSYLLYEYEVLNFKRSSWQNFIWTPRININIYTVL